MASSESKDVTFHLEGDEELTEEQLQERFDDLMNAESVTVSKSLKRQILSKYEPDEWFMSMSTSVSGVAQLIENITELSERKKAKRLLLGSLLGKLGGQFNFISKVLNAQATQTCVAAGVDPSLKIIEPEKK